MTGLLGEWVRMAVKAGFVMASMRAAKLGISKLLMCTLSGMGLQRRAKGKWAGERERWVRPCCACWDCLRLEGRLPRTHISNQKQKRQEGGRACRPVGRVEVVHGRDARTDPLGEILSVGDGSRQGYHADARLALGLLGTDRAHPADNHLGAQVGEEARQQRERTAMSGALCYGDEEEDRNKIGGD